MNQSTFILLGLVLLSIVCLLLALLVGSVDLPLPVIMQIFDQPEGIPAEIVLKLRLPRAICAFATGGLLALAGALMQVLLINPLAEPYILGVSGGAACATLMALLLGVAALWIPLFSCVGGLLAMLLLFVLAIHRRHWSPQTLLLTGVMMAAGWGALISLILSVSSQQQLHGMLFWLLGDLSDARYPTIACSVLLLATLYSLYLAPQLNILQHGDLMARALGVCTRRLSWQLFVLTSLLTGVAVSLAGTIGFIGLLVPHLVRLMHSSDHRFVIPASVLSGGSLLVCADMLARSLLAPQQLPVGVLTALLGVPVFLWLLRRRQVME